MELSHPGQNPISNPGEAYASTLGEPLTALAMFFTDRHPETQRTNLIPSGENLKQLRVT